jgi:ABC-2 type transport system permease protein
MPVWLRAICEWNPLSAWPLTHPVTASLLWVGLLLAIFVPLSARRFARAGL